MKIKYIVVILILIISAISLNVNIGNKQPNTELSETNDDVSNPLNLASMPAQQPSSKDIPYLYNFPEKGIPVLMYHSISTNPDNSLCVSEKQFKEEMDWLRNRNYHSLTIEEFYQALTNNALLPERPILLTFDDGYADNYNTAWPILHQNDFRATFFIIINTMGFEGMDWNQIKELVRQGNSIGSHTVKHLDLTSLSAEQQKSELMVSKQKLEEQLGINIKAFCFPSGRYNKTTLNLLENLGYIIGFSTHPGRVHLGDNQYILKRVRISGGMPLSAFQNLVP